MPRVVHFEIHAGEPERAISFYQSVFGWQFQKWEGPLEYWMIITGAEGTPGINGGLVKRTSEITGDSVIAYVCTIDVPSVDEYADKIAANGGTIVVPKMPIPGVAWLVYAKDTEGNIFGVHQEDASAG